MTERTEDIIRGFMFVVIGVLMLVGLRLGWDVVWSFLVHLAAIMLVVAGVLYIFRRL